MATLRHIRRKIQSVRSTQTITNTMKMVSASKLRRAQEEFERVGLYAKKMEELVRNVIGTLSDISHPLLDEREKRRALVFACASDRGLCGSFNMNVVGRVEGFISDKSYESVALCTFGRKIRDYFRRRGVPIVEEYVDVRRLEIDLSRTISARLIELFLEGKFDVVFLCYTHFLSPLRQEVVLERLLPIPIPRERAKGEYLLEPSLEQILSTLLPKYVTTRLHYALIDSSTSEHAARMNAMENATDNCGKVLQSLTLLFNKTRQESITKEMMDIVGGAEALRER